MYVDKIRFLLVILFIPLFWIKADAQVGLNSGLYFNSHEVIQDERTSLNLTPTTPLSIQEKLVMDFDIRFRPGDGYYGYIFKMLGNESVPIDLVSNLASETENFWLVVGDQSVLSFYWKDLGGVIYNEWAKIKLTYTPSSGEFTLSINGIEKKVILEDFTNIEDFQIVFGASKVTEMLNSDVCPMTLKNIRLHDSDILLRNWELKKHSKGFVYDEVKSHAAEVKFPNWEIDKHVNWRKSQKIVMPGLLGITSNPSSDSIFIVGLDQLKLYNTSSGEISTYSYQFGNPFPCLDNNFIYNPLTKEIWSYSFDTVAINKLDLKSFRWTSAPDTCPEPDLWHHVRLFNAPENEIITFGGYGHYTYKSNLMILKDGSLAWDSINKSNQIPPRYLSSMGWLDDQKVLLFGGYGSPTGNQGINPQHYYDLYTLDLATKNVEKIRELVEGRTPFTPIANAVLAEDKSSFYTLIYNNINYNTHLQLAEIGIEKEEFKVYEDSIPYNFLDTKSWAGLFLNASESKLIAITQTDSLVEIYQQAYPPLLKDQAAQPEKSSTGNIKLFAFFAGAFVLTALIIAYLKYRKHPAPVEFVKENQDDSITHVSPVENRKSASVILMGGFQIFDSSGTDITGQFTPTIKQLFLLIYLSSILDKKGISSELLTELLWSDKSATSARNNRNVNISKIRLILEKVSPQLTLTHDNTFWKIEHDQSVYSDVLDSLQLIQKVKSNHRLTELEVERLLNNSAKGGICPSVQADWVDQFKADFTAQLLDGLFEMMRQTQDHQLIAKLSDSILKLDPLNDDALKKRCYSLFKLGKKGQALTTYNQFCKDYLNLLGQEFELEFNDLVSENGSSDK
ncbi:hypothetical protein [uncultured Algoriphagus sp.]|uniref:hypothetical protein n=1 Tax=uncultured Algoriphagus sp. TaxID=417365 RepID=UPI0030EDC934|tara:strand:- start:6426 stop:8969 length:2544 start_codon:yes stop_codon:yes gene_type:complete